MCARPGMGVPSLRPTRRLRHANDFWEPLHDRVVVKRIEAEEKTAGGIIIPDTAKEKPQQGEVIVVGPGGRHGQHV